MQFYVSVKINH